MKSAARRWVVVLIAISVACNQPPKQAARRGANEPKLRAVVITIQTAMQPSKKTLVHTIVLAENRARSSDEADSWRLFDFAAKRVLFVDDISRTYRVVPFDALLRAHRQSMTQPVPDSVPRAQFVQTGAQKTLQGVPARQAILKLGGYQRELWIGTHPLVPAELFSLLHASEPVSSPLAGIMRTADEALLNVRGYPLIDHAELPFGNKRLVVDKSVVSIDQRDVPLSLLNIARDYKDVTPPPATAPAGRPRRAS